MCKNIDLFNRCCVAVLGKLYSEFPVPILLRVSDAAALVGLERLDDTTREIYAETITFLSDEGFIHVGSEIGKATTNRMFSNVRLTSKGLAALNRTPKELSDSPSVGERIAGWTTELVRDASKEVIRGAIQSLFG